VLTYIEYPIIIVWSLQYDYTWYLGRPGPGTGPLGPQTGPNETRAGPVPVPSLRGLGPARTGPSDR
jgi:hypothetical protein